jgi:hypothetical protein
MAISMASNTDKPLKPRKRGILRTSIEKLKPCFLRLEKTLKTFHSPRKSSVPRRAVESTERTHGLSASEFSLSHRCNRPSPASKRVNFLGAIVEYVPPIDLLGKHEEEVRIIIHNEK